MNKKIPLFLTLTIAICCSALSQTTEYRFGENCFRIMAPQLDGYSVTHVAMGGVFYGIARVFMFTPENSAWTSCVLSLAYEVVVDGFGNQLFGVGLPPDKRGFDIGDVCFGVLGAGLAYLCERQYLICKRLQIASTGRMLAVAIEL